MDVSQARRLEDCTPLYRGIVEKAYSGKASPRTAIKAFCLACVGYVRKDVTECPATGCPLHAYRPYQGD